MNIYFFTRLLKRKSEFEMFNLARLCVIFFTVLFCETLQGQICDKKTTIYFETDQFSIQTSENPKLEKLIKLFAQKTDTFLLEIDAFTDSVASVEHNYKLATNRLKTILGYIKKNSSAHFEIKERVRGEAMPLGSNGTEEGRAKNRRVDIFYWKLKGDRITLKGKGGTEIDVQKDYFGPCGICESNPKITEVSTNEEAARQGVSLTTTDGDELITGGMMRLDFNCRGNTSRCADVVIRIPAANYDEKMEVWKSSGNTSNGRWNIDQKGQLDYDAKNECYIMTVNYCAGDMINCDRPARPDSGGLIAAPELTRKKRATYVNSATQGNVIYGARHITNLLWHFYYRKKGSIFFADSGVGKNKIGYMFSDIIDRYEADCDTACREQKKCWCFEIPIDDYTKLIYFQKKKRYRLKVPRKYRDYTPRLFIPAADTLIPLTRMAGSSRKYFFQKPVPDTYIVVYSENANLKNKRGFDVELDLEGIHAKYSKRKKYYKAKIKRKYFKKTGSKNPSP